MMRTISALGIASGALAAVALALGTTAMGQTNSSRLEVQIEASKVVVVKPKYAPRGFQDETVELSAQVKFADLDIATDEGEAALHRRISAAATAICTQLGTMYFSGSATTEQQERDACIKRAVDEAAERVKPIIAAAREDKHAEPQNGEQGD